jgi:hypothetical protein
LWTSGEETDADPEATCRSLSSQRMRIGRVPITIGLAAAASAWSMHDRAFGERRIGSAR